MTSLLALLEASWPKKAYSALLSLPTLLLPCEMDSSRVLRDASEGHASSRQAKATKVA